MKTSSYTFRWGLRDGIMIAFGYLPVSFAFGIFAVAEGLTPWQAILISALNVTSAGQLAGVPLFLSGASVFEMGLTQLLINLRYSLMSITLSQKLDDSLSLADRFLISYVHTDEIFAVTAGKVGLVGKAYLYGVILTPYFGWLIGTALGAYAGNVLPSVLITALGFAIYGMFFSILIPAAKKNRAVMVAEIIAVILSSAIAFVPFLSFISSGFAVIIAAGVSSLLMAILHPIPVKTEDSDDE